MKTVRGKVKYINIDFPRIEIKLEKIPVPFECYDVTLYRIAQKIEIGDTVEINFTADFNLPDITPESIDVIMFQQISKI